KWERFSDVVLLPDSAFRNEWGTYVSEKLWGAVAKALKSERVARLGEISGEMRESSVEMLLGEDDWVMRRESGVDYGYNLTQCMFSAGNVNERRRMGEVVGTGEIVVDLYAGIGYYSLPMLVHSQVGHVHCCEWNPNAVRALEANLESNGVAGRSTVHFGDNRVTAANLEGIADRVILGLLPSAEDGYALAMAALKPAGGMLHVHGVAATNNHAAWVADVTESLCEIKGKFSVDTAKPLRVKSYAPHWDHVVLDVTISGG
ncbi:MAG: methyltransferase, partial [Candidatus Thermoplasmatota archaeon]|nr:methyltransferase [Candidatus Thermoplasmatota archaeon]